jgi:hypothetical protein
MEVGNLSCRISPNVRRFARRKLILLLAAICLPLMSTGCLCLSFGGCESCGAGDHPESNGVLTQKGGLPSSNGGPVTVYYPVPYASPPNLELHDQLNKCRIVEQRADGFVVQDGQGLLGVSWTARGVKGPPSTPGTPTPVVAAQPPANEAMPVVPTVFSR